jgi:hypothetical protein
VEALSSAEPLGLFERPAAQRWITRRDTLCLGRVSQEMMMTMALDEPVELDEKPSGMSLERKLIALRKRLVEAQRGLLAQAANVEALPSVGALRQIADLESAIVATETMIEEERGQTS